MDSSDIAGAYFSKSVFSDADTEEEGKSLAV